MPDTDSDIDEDCMRMLLTGAASVIEEYALGPRFNWQRDQDIIRSISQNAEKLIAIVDMETANG